MVHGGLIPAVANVFHRHYQIGSPGFNSVDCLSLIVTLYRQICSKRAVLSRQDKAGQPYIDGLVKGLNSRHPGEGRDPELSVITGFRPSLE
jgi:hypothetical protein